MCVAVSVNGTWVASLFFSSPFCVVLLRGPILIFHSAGRASQSSATFGSSLVGASSLSINPFNFSIYMSFSGVSLRYSQHASFFITSADFHQSYRFGDWRKCHSLSPPAENWARFIEADPHVHRVHTTVHFQLDCRANSFVSELQGCPRPTLRRCWPALPSSWK